MTDSPLSTFKFFSWNYRLLLITSPPCVLQHEQQLLTSMRFLDEHKFLINLTDARHFSSGRGKGASHGSGGRGTSNKVCTYCGRIGHTVEICYVKHGYPLAHPHYPRHPCFHDQNAIAAFVNNSMVDVGHEVKDDAVKGETQGARLRLTQDQYHCLLTFLQLTAN